jgi:elongation factor Ts
MATTAEQVKKLRDETGAGMMDCKKALDASGGDYAKAVAWLQEKGLSAAAKKAGREASDGVIEVYTHMGGRMAVMVEVNCETDFVARSPEFRELAHNVAIQIASSAPIYVKREDVPAAEIAAQTGKFKEEIIKQGKPENIAERAAAGKMESFYAETCLMEQIFVKDPDGKQKVKDMITAAVSKIGENIVVRRFSRYQLGETVQSAE